MKEIFFFFWFVKPSKTVKLVQNTMEELKTSVFQCLVVLVIDIIGKEIIILNASY